MTFPPYDIPGPPPPGSIPQFQIPGFNPFHVNPDYALIQAQMSIMNSPLFQQMYQNVNFQPMLATGFPEVEDPEIEKKSSMNEDVIFLKENNPPQNLIRRREDHNRVPHPEPTSSEFPPSEIRVPETLEEIFAIIDVPIPELNQNTWEISKAFEICFIYSKIQKTRFTKKLLNLESGGLDCVMSQPFPWSSLSEIGRFCFTRMYNLTRVGKSMEKHIWKLLKESEDVTSSEYEKTIQLMSSKEKRAPVKTSSDTLGNSELKYLKTFSEKVNPNFDEKGFLALYAQELKKQVNGVQKAIEMCRPGSENIGTLNNLKKTIKHAVKVLEEPSEEPSSSEATSSEKPSSQKTRNSEFPEFVQFPPTISSDDIQNAILYGTGPYGCYQKLLTEQLEHQASSNGLMLLKTSSGLVLSSQDNRNPSESVPRKPMTPSHLTATPKSRIRDISNTCLKRKTPMRHEEDDEDDEDDRIIKYMKLELLDK